MQLIRFQKKIIKYTYKLMIYLFIYLFIYLTLLIVSRNLGLILIPIQVNSSLLDTNPMI